MGMLVDIYTNGCLINEGIVEKLKANPPVNMKISMYGASDETYETMCRYKNGFTKLDRALGLLKEAGLPFYCTSLVVNENKHDLAAMYKYAGERGIRFFHTISVANSVRESINTADASKLDLSSHTWTLEGLEKERHTTRYLEPFQLCAGYSSTMFLTWHGHMQFCAFSPKPYVQVGYGAEMADAWKELLAMTDQIQTPKECETCEWHEFCRRCPGLMASESGDPNVLSPKFCRQAKDLYDVYQRLKAEEKQSNTDAATDADR
jgi:radical SAM protein with 4Fe4S-binding SPASM domain